MLEIIGLILIAIAWILQVLYSWQGKKNIQTSFLALYIIGVFMITYQSFKDSSFISSLLNSIILVLSILLFIKINFKKRKGYVHLR